jgi:hypothetical protein
MQITECQFNPINFQIENNEFGLNQDFITQLEQRLLEVQFTTPNQRIQFELSSQIIQKLLNTYENFSINNIEIRCDDRFNYNYDGVFINEQSRIGLEIQFRPDFLKDITRFQMGINSGRIQAIIYVVAIKRKTINREYTTMPEYARVVKHLSLLGWFQIPVLVLGINCDNNN